jgi:molecular chaperone GrpE
MSSERRNDDQEPVVVRDRRRIDPLTGEARVPEHGSGTGPAPAEQSGHAPAGGDAGVDGDTGPDPTEAKLADLAARLDERTADLQRVSAEYANYRRRVERDREAVVASAKASVVGELLTVLDDVARAQQHGDLTGPFKAVADKLVATLNRAGLEPFGAEGDEFDPSVHEAVQHNTSPDVSGSTVSLVMRQGYRIGERVLRPAMVAVTDQDRGAGSGAGVPESGDEHRND